MIGCRDVRMANVFGNSSKKKAEQAEKRADKAEKTIEEQNKLINELRDKLAAYENN